MVAHFSLLVLLVQLVERIPMPPPPAKPGRGRPRVYQDRLFLKALVIMLVRHLNSAYEFLAVVEQPTLEMQTLREVLCRDTPEGQWPSRRTWERRLAAIPATLPAQIGCLGRYLVGAIDPFAACGRAVAMDSTLLRAFGGYAWHKKQREAGLVPHTGIDTEAAWTKSGHHGWVYGWALHLVATAGPVWIPLAAQLTPANEADNEVAPLLLNELPDQVRFVLGDTHYNAPQVRQECALRGRTLVASGHGSYPHPDDANNSKAVRQVLHKLRSVTIENFNQQFKGIFDGHRSVPTKGRVKTQRWALSAVLVYQLLLFYRWESHLSLRVGLKACLKAA